MGLQMKHYAIITTTLFLVLVTTGLPAQDEKATITFFIGDVTIVTKDKPVRHASAGMNLDRNDTVRTGKNSMAEIITGTSHHYIMENMSVKIASLSAEQETPPFLGTMKRIMGSSCRSWTATSAVRGNSTDGEIIWSTDKSLTSSRDGSDTGADTEILDHMRTLLSDGKHSDAWSYYNSARISPGKKENLDFMGAMSAYNLCRYDEAARIFDSLSRKAKDARIKDESAFYAGVCLHSIARYRESIPCFTKYLAAKSNNTYACQAYFLRGVAYLNTSSKDKALQDLRQVTALSPSDPLAQDAEKILKDMK